MFNFNLSAMFYKIYYNINFIALACLIGSYWGILVEFFFCKFMDRAESLVHLCIDKTIIVQRQIQEIQKWAVTVQLLHERKLARGNAPTLDAPCA